MATAGTEDSPESIKLDPSDIRMGIRSWNDEKERLIRETGKPILKIVNLNKVCGTWPFKAVTAAMDAEAVQTKNEGGLLVIVTQTGYE